MKRSRFSLMTATLSLAIALSGCITTGPHRNEDGGKILGGIVGGLLGYKLIGGGNGRILGAGLGALAGYLVGEAIGRQMDDNDRVRLMDSTDRGLRMEPGRGAYTERWRNGNRHYETHVAPRSRYLDRGTICREFTQQTIVTIDGQQEVAERNGVACQDRSGAWHIMP